MKMLSFRDVERLSAYLDGQLSQAKRTRLESRLEAAPELAAILNDLRQARGVLRKTPKRRAPRNFTLTPKVTGVRPPIPRAVPALSWASVAATLAFLFTLGTNFLGGFALASTVPAMANGMGGGNQIEDTQQAYGIGGGTAATELPMKIAGLETPTAETPALEARGIMPTNEIFVTEPAVAPEPRNESFSPWPFAWLGLAALLVGAALLVRWLNQQAFKKRLNQR